MRAILVCVDYADILSLTLPYNRKHFEEVFIVTSLTDGETKKVASDNKCPYYATDVFYKNGASFNKWLALEYGLDVMGREGWICIMDADVAWPKDIYSVVTCDNILRLAANRNEYLRKQEINLKPGMLCSPLRRMCTEIKEIPDESTWRRYLIHRNVAEFAGYSQIFHASDPVLKGKKYWHQTDWKHAGGADSFFQNMWSVDDKIRPPFEVLHLGSAGTNWCGRVTPMSNGEIPERSEERMHTLCGFIKGRFGKTGNSRFEHEKIKEVTQDIKETKLDT